MAAVRIENDAWIDGRYAMLAELCGLEDPRFALILCGSVWSQCTERCDEFMSGAMIDAIAKRKGFAEAMAASELADKPREEDGKYRVRGTRGRIEWLQSRRGAGKKGGEAKAAKELAHASEVPRHEASSPVAPNAFATPAVVASCSYSSYVSEKEEKESAGADSYARAPASGEARVWEQLKEVGEQIAHGLSAMSPNDRARLEACLPAMRRAAAERGIPLGTHQRESWQRFTADPRIKRKKLGRLGIYLDEWAVWADDAPPPPEPPDKVRLLTHAEHARMASEQELPDWAKE